MVVHLSQFSWFFFFFNFRLEYIIWELKMIKCRCGWLKEGRSVNWIWHRKICVDFFIVISIFKTATVKQLLYIYIICHCWMCQRMSHRRVKYSMLTIKDKSFPFQSLTITRKVFLNWTHNNDFHNFQPQSFNVTALNTQHEIPAISIAFFFLFFNYN